MTHWVSLAEQTAAVVVAVAAWPVAVDPVAVVEVVVGTADTVGAGYPADLVVAWATGELSPKISATAVAETATVEGQVQRTS